MGTTRRGIAPVIAVLLCAAAAGGGEPSSLQAYFLDGDPVAKWKLPKRLKEISGLASTPDGRLFGHDDETATLYQLDFEDDEIVKSFSLGTPALRGDFEGLAVANDRFFLVSSSGRLHEAREGEDGDSVDFVVHETKLGRHCEIEGLAYEPEDDTLLLLCKTSRKKKFRNFVVVHRWSLAAGESAEPPHLLVPLIDILDRIEAQSFRPSGIERHPISGNYFIVAAREGAIAEITSSGALVSARSLPKRHRQVEGIAFSPDGGLVLGDEGSKSRARLTVYRARPAAGRADSGPISR